MTKLFHRLSTRIVLEILLAVAVSAAIYAGANAALTRFFQQYATEPAVFRRLSDRHFQDLQRFAQENHLVSTDPVERPVSLRLPDGHPPERGPVLQLLRVL